MQKLIERHPLPWTRSEKPEFLCFFVYDATKKIVVTLSAFDETTTEQANDQGGVATTTIRTERPGVRQLADMIVALPELMRIVTDTHAAIDRSAHEVSKALSDASIGPRLEAMIERLAS